ncbi:hypothetical protein EJ05DRAFT_482673 [Pseudovirgaria hyperparasitica]|uniref:Zn(2)-C6 fungal-type domain-containing protein n=1 Tax=Pseudovirgaria hyperparasitica TaxID=470096 RepID=A0A6A6WHY5_9PEZI|nr:uncharacterized protein EJ05DRAFT_482673 [Pseudovirgaria hyperparasitica]KAF2761849.1 hypothetical protein EJ05DRAFT_482673 [Pseudovirgaria hyperparasitica]
MPSGQIAKRSACDRCRDLKLRCTREQTADEHVPCDRCTRFDALCITGSGRRLGRPSVENNDTRPIRRNSSNHQHRNDRNSWQRLNHRPLTTNNTLGPPRPDNPKNDNLYRLADSDFFSDPNLDPMLYESDFLGGSSSATPANNANGNGQLPMTLGIDTSDLPDLDVDSPCDMTALSSSTMPALANPNKRPASRNDSGIVLNQSAEADSSSLAGVISDTSRQLFELRSKAQHHSLETMLDQRSVSSDINAVSRQLSDLRNRASESSIDSIMTSAGIAHDFARFNDPIKTGPLESMLSTSMRFILVLQMLAPAEYDTGSTSRPRTSSNSTALDTMLMLLSIYVRLGQSFEHVLNGVVQNRNFISSGSQPSSPASTYNQQYSAQLMMVVRALGHQLSTVERLMGIPARVRLWGPKDDYPGILNQDQSFLTKAAISQAQETFYSLRRTMHDIEISCT